MESNIQANELRIGNVLQYTTAEGDKMFTSIDWQDLKWIDEDEKGFNSVHNRVLLTEEILLKCGFYKFGKNHPFYRHNKKKIFTIELGVLGNKYHFRKYASKNESLLLKEIKYLHQLQNLYFALTGEELEVNL